MLRNLVFITSSYVTLYLLELFSVLYHRDQTFTGLPTKEAKQDMPAAQRKSSDQDTPAAAARRKQRTVSVSSLTVIDGPNNIKTKRVSAATMVRVI